MPFKPPTHRPRFQPQRRSDHLVRGSAHERGYGSDWRRFRLRFLREHPLCCLANHPYHRHECTHAASVVDHVRPLTQGGGRLSEENCRAVCRVAHDRLTENLKATGRNELPPPKLATGGWV